MKRRVISLLAIVALLCTMVVFAMPASAAATDAYAEIVADAASGAENLQAAIDANADEATLLQAAKDAKATIVWKTFDWKNEPYPRYAYHAAYEAAGYDGKNWSITEKEDWFAMDAYAISQTAAGDFFTGVTFHLTGNVDFAEEPMFPLGAGTSKKMVFAGTLDGHGYSFENVNIDIIKSADSDFCYTKTSFYNGSKFYGSIGLFGFIAGTVQNFGVHSGDVEVGTGNASINASTFGTIAGGRTATFNNVWSGMTMKTTANPFTSALVGSYASESVTVHVNGFVFYGEAKTANNASYPYVYAIMGGASVAPAEGSSFANIITYPTAPGSVTAGNVEVYMLGAAEDFSLSDYTIKNVYGMKKEAGTTGAGVHLDYRNKLAKLTGGKGTSLIWDGTLLEAAADSNSKQTGAAAPVYFIATEDGNLRPVAADANGAAPNGAIAKVIYKIGDETVAEVLTTSGTTLTKAEMLAKLDLAEAEVKMISVNGSELTEDSIVAGITTTVVADPSSLGQLGEIIKKYESLEKKYLTDESIAALDKFVADAKAITDDAAAIEFLKTEAALIASLDTYHAFPFAEGKEIPAYSLKDTYGAFNHTQNWVIKTKEDWAAMRDVADVATADYFKGATFHLVDDVDFGLDAYIAPMGINTNGAGFAGTLDGHGFGFNNIYVSKNDIFGDKTTGGKDIKHTGLFLRLADCTIKDFGLNSGLIVQTSSNAAGAISSFGTVVAGKIPTFERVWSSAYISAQCNARANGLVSTIDNAPITINVNGYVFDGALVKRIGDSNQFSYAVLDTGNDNANPGLFYNIISDSESYNGKASVSDNSYNVTKEDDSTVQSALFDFSTLDVLNTLSMGNVYGVKRKTNGIQGGFSIGNIMSSVSKSAALMTDMSAVEAAYTINEKNQKGEIPEGVEPIYFTLNSEGKVRPIPAGKSEGKIVKIIITGDADRSVFVNAGSTVDLKTTLGYTSNISFELKEGECVIEGTSVTLGTGDITLEMTNSCTEHDLGYTQGDKEHTGVCSICNHQVIEACKLINCTSNAMDWNAATHTGTCEKCGNVFSELCDYEYKKTDDGYKYVCVCNRIEDAAAPMVAGDLNGDSEINLVDAVRLLKKVASVEVEMIEKNADVDGDNDKDITDVYKIVLNWIGNFDVISEMETIQHRVNEGNHFDVNDATCQNLKMDGTLGENERYVVTDSIEVSKGNKVVFGPIRKAQAVMGHFYDKDGNSIELINVNNKNLKTEHVFKAEVQGRDVEILERGEYGIKDAFIGELLPKAGNGLEMVSIIVPEGAAYVRLQANAEEADKFYIRINNEFSLADYQYRTKADANTLKNEENGQYFLTVGDSLCSAARDDQDPTVPQKGWEGRIRRDLGAVTVDSSQGGSTISIKKYLVSGNADLDTEGTSTSFDPKKCILNQLTMHRGNGTAFEYILLEGGGNDAAYDAEVGYIANSYDPKDFAPAETFIGNLERMIYSAIKTYGDTVALGFLVAYPMPKDNRFVDMGNYFQHVEAVCEKWDIPYLDFFYDEEKNIDTDVYTTNDDHTRPDNIHVGGAGYDIMQKYITPFVENEMRPANQEIYLEIQNYEEVPQNLGKK